MFTKDSFACQAAMGFSRKNHQNMAQVISCDYGIFMESFLQINT